MSTMRILKDIKISKDRLPIQNALWIRPMGGLSFKIYVPSGTDWKEVGIDNKPSPSPTPTPSKTTKKNNCEGGKVIANKVIPRYPKIGDKYYFADGYIKILGDKINPEDESKKPARWIECYTKNKKLLKKISQEEKGHVRDSMRRLSKDDFKGSREKVSNHKPIIAVIVKGGRCTINSIEIIGGAAGAAHTNCDTTSQNFKIIDGYLRNVKAIGYGQNIKILANALLNKVVGYPREMTPQSQKKDIRMRDGWIITYFARRKRIYRNGHIKKTFRFRKFRVFENGTSVSIPCVRNRYVYLQRVKHFRKSPAVKVEFIKDTMQNNKSIIILRQDKLR